MQVHSMPSTGKNSQTPKGPNFENFWYCETKNFRRKILIPLLCKKLSEYQNLSETQKGSSTKINFIVRQKNFEGNCNTPVTHNLSIAEAFRYTKRARPRMKFFRRQKVSHKFLRYPFRWFNKIFAIDKRTEPEIFRNIKYFKYFQKYEKSRVTKFSVLQTKKFLTCFSDTLR